MGRARVGSVGLAVTVAMGLAVPAARAGETEDLGSVNGLNYRATSLEVQPGTAAAPEVACGPDDRAIGGGIDIVDPDFSPGLPEGTTMGDTRPVTEAGAGAWRTLGINDATDPVDMTYFAICADRSDVIAKARKTMIATGDRGKVRVSCPSGYEVAGGGMQADGALLASVPFDDDDRNGRPDDGWRASTYNAGPSPIALRAHASCVPAPSWDLTYLRAGAATQGGHLVHEANICAEDSALAGLGAKVRGGEGPHDVSIRELYPQNDFLPEGDAPSEVMFAAFANESDATAGMTAVGICRG
jgi:hypothetical protein